MTPNRLYSFKTGKNGTIESLTEYAKNIINNHVHFQYNLHNRLLDVDRLYMREADFTEEQRKAKLANKYGDVAKLQNVQTPIVANVVEDSVSFLSNVYLMNYPMFNLLGDKDSMEQAEQLNTLIGEDQIHFGWVPNFNLAFRDGSKYNIAALEVDWDRQKTLKVERAGTSSIEQIYEGNSIKRKDPYNLIYDTRVPMHKMHEKGEYAGYIELETYIGIRKLFAQLGEDRIGNVDDVLKSPTNNWIKAGRYFPELNYSVLNSRNNNQGNNQVNADINWYSWIGRTDTAGKTMQYQPYYFKLVLYCQLVPQDYSIRGPNDGTPGIWKLIFINGILVYARNYPTLTQFLPMVFVQPMCDGLDLQTKSSAENVADYQRISSALWNAKLASARRRTTDRMLYNPLLVDPDHINNPNPSAKIPVRQMAYGRKLEEAVYAIPFHDENSQYFVQEAQLIEQMAQKSAGQNNVTQGQFQKGNKLQDEFQTVMANAGNRDRTQAVMWEFMGMMPIKHHIRNNYMLNIKEVTRFNRKSNEKVKIDPAAIRESLTEFEIGDGLLPAQKVMGTGALTQALQYMQSSPALAQEYDTSSMFTYLMATQGAKELDDFKKPKEQVAYEQAMGSWQAVAMEAVKKGATPPPQPKPADYGYNPKQVTGEEKDGQPANQQQSQPGS